MMYLYTTYANELLNDDTNKGTLQTILVRIGAMKGGNKREVWKNYYQTSRCTHISNRHRKVGQKKREMKAVAEK